MPITTKELATDREIINDSDYICPCCMKKHSKVIEYVLIESKDKDTGETFVHPKVYYYCPVDDVRFSNSEQMTQNWKIGLLLREFWQNKKENLQITEHKKILDALSVIQDVCKEHPKCDDGCPFLDDEKGLCLIALKDPTHWEITNEEKKWKALK